MAQFAALSEEDPPGQAVAGLGHVELLADHVCLEKDGYRARHAVHAGRRVLLRSGQGTGMTAFPEIRTAALAQLPTDTGLDGKLVVWERDRLTFERLQRRLALRGAGAAEAAPVAGALRDTTGQCCRPAMTPLI
ncbi:hypothetical protein ACFYZB_34900 [Streptomyces sp. NPDC001852]|uniref:hypothetical protein n=1 Tax=Streptomyces sp. NPDC001852 TaxID=3364619 RepID=UPI003691EF31